MLTNKRASIFRVSLAVVVVVIILIAGASYLVLSTPPQPTAVSSTSTSPSPSLTSSAVNTITAGTTPSLQKVTFLLAFVPNEFSAAYYYGIDLGIYTKYGIDLTIQSGSGAAAGISFLSAGKADFAEGDPLILTIVAAQQHISNVRFISVMHKQTPFAVIYNKATINTLKDLDGKSEGNFQGSSDQPMFQILSKINGLNYSSIKIVYVTPAQVNTLVATGKTDFILQTINNYATVQNVATQNNIQTGYFLFADYGIHVYGQGIVTTTDIVQNNPKLAQAFVRATLESYVATAKNPAAAITSLVKHNPQLGYKDSLDGLNLVLAHDFSDINSTQYSSSPLKWGWVDSSVMQNVFSLASQGFNVTPPADSQIYTNEFVQQP